MRHASTSNTSTCTSGVVKTTTAVGFLEKWQRTRPRLFFSKPIFCRSWFLFFLQQSPYNISIFVKKNPVYLQSESGKYAHTHLQGACQRQVFVSFQARLADLPSHIVQSHHCTEGRFITRSRRELSFRTSFAGQEVARGTQQQEGFGNGKKGSHETH